MSDKDRGYPVQRSIDDQLIGHLRDEQGIPKVIKLLEEIRDRLAGVRPVIIIPTTTECEQFGRKL